MPNDMSSVSLDLRARLKRDLSINSLNSSTHSQGSSLRSAKRSKSDSGFRRKVSFGHLNETVLFDKTDSSNNLSLGVSVSNSSFGGLRDQGSANSRWGESQPQSDSTNASWAAPPVMPPRESRWECGLPSESGGLFIHSSSTSNSSRSIAIKNSGAPARSTSFTQVKLPTRSTSPIYDASMEVERGLARATSFTAPPRRPGRCQSPVFGGPPPPQYTTILPVPIRSTQETHDDSSTFAPVFGAPPEKSDQFQSPVIVTPRSSFNLLDSLSNR